MTGALIQLLCLVLILGVIWWVSTLLPLPVPLPVVIQVIIVVIFVIALVDLLLGFSGGGFFPGRPLAR